MTQAATSTKSDTCCSHHAPTIGAFCWWELHTRNTAVAETFYTKLFGWTATTCPPAPNGAHTYTEWANGGPQLGGMMTMPAQVPAQVPANWSAYLNVADVDASVALATKLGGSVVVPAMDIPNTGRFATIKDPTGACFNVFKGLPGTGSGGLKFGNGNFCWIELMTSDPTAANKFYSELLGWQPTANDMATGVYTTYGLKGSAAHDKSSCVGGMMKIPAEWGSFPSNWHSYVWVDDLDGTCARVAALGGKIECPPKEIPGVGRIAQLVDPTGAHLGLFSSLPTMAKKGSCGSGCGCGG